VVTESTPGNSRDGFTAAFGAKAGSDSAELPVGRVYESIMHFQFTDGGREAAGFKGDAGDCVTRAIAIALNLPYREVYDGLASRMAATGNARSARNGIPRRVYETYLAERGWRWYPLQTSCRRGGSSPGCRSTSAR
jgi:hypothetical protein